MASVAAQKARSVVEDGDVTIMLSLPSIHCASCISGVERGMSNLPEVHDIRVNLTQKRAVIQAAAGTEPAAMAEALTRMGFEAYELDAGALAQTETDRQGRELLMRLGVAFFSMMNIMLLSVAVWSGADGVTRDLFHMISAAIAVPTVIFSGQPFFRSAWRSLRGWRLGMDVPISLAIILATGISLYETFHSGHHAYFEAAVMLTFFLLAGRYLDFRTRAMARSAAQELAALEVPRAIRLDAEGVETTVPVAELAIGDRVLVRPGGRVPVDGVVLAGRSELDRALLTGETLPAFAGEGTAVSAGEVNLTGPLTVRVESAGTDTSLHRMAELVAMAENARTRYTALADRAARAYSPVVHILAFGAFAVWMIISAGDARLAINIAAATLIITCPCALGLAVPAVVTAASGRLFGRGLLIKDGTALERLAEVDTAVFDKTGTLTMGTPVPVNLDDLPTEVHGVALALAAGSSHPLARALDKALRQRDVSAVALDDLAEVPGYGVEATWNGQRVRLGRAEWVGAEARDMTAAYLQIEQTTHAYTFTDQLRPGAGELIAALGQMGKDVWLLSGDAPGPVAEMAQRLGIENWQASALPQDKAAKIVALSEAGHYVLMVGDGLNDTAALAAADVSISPASALDAARVASDMVLLGQNIAPIADALTTARLSTKRIRENFALSFGYNIIAVPIALLGLCTPIWAAAAMSLSSITVVLNAMRIKQGAPWKS